MPAIRLARRPAVRPTGLAARAGLVLLVALAGLLVASRLQTPPAVRTIAVGRAPTAVGVDARTRRVFVANYGAASVTMLDATSEDTSRGASLPSPTMSRWTIPGASVCWMRPAGAACASWPWAGACICSPCMSAPAASLSPMGEMPA